MRHVLITGCAGFLGSHLVLHHVAKGDRVYGVDNYASSKPLSHYHRKTIKDGRDKYFFMIADISNSDFPRIFKDIPLDIIYNFACPTASRRREEIPLETMMTCVAGTYNVLSAAKHSTVIVHASLPHESFQDRKDSFYVDSKKAAETLCNVYRQKKGVDVRIARIYDTYGPHMQLDDDRTFVRIIDKLIKKESLSLYEKNDELLKLCYVDDVINEIAILVELKHNPEATTNIGIPKETSAADFAAMAISTANAFKQELNLNSNEGLYKTIDYFLKNVDA